MMNLIIPPLLIALSVMLIAKLLSTISTPSHEKSSPFECGFDPKCSARVPFSSRYFLLAVFFLVFDIETAILLPLPLANHSPHTQLISASVFIIILLLGLLHEWREGSLSWS